ncbi:MAG: GNAT family N-acetyltransferase [Bacteroidales bacterium]|jgi:ribosomal-protein-serine acetyltransferase|nr:GNAT family N-acetyltransferase [Bacteroidales bacterium]
MKLTVNNMISLEILRHDHAFIIFQAIDQNREFLAPWLPFVDTAYSQEDSEEFVRAVLNENSREQVFVIRFHDRFAGLIGLKDIDNFNDRLEIGYWLTKDMTGHGIMLQSVRTLIDFTVREYAINRIQIRCAVGNTASASIPKKLGFTFEGIERAGEKHSHGYVDLEVYSLLRKEWDSLTLH